MNGTPGRLFALLLLILAACAPEPKRPSVVLILIDTLRPDHLELYGYERATAPWIAEVGARGAVFPRAYSSSAWTPPSTASVFTGLYPTGHGLIHGFETDAWVKKQLEQGRELEIEVARLPEELPTLPERFQRAGYATLGFTTNPHINAAFGFERGFDVFHAKSEEPVSSVVDAVLALRAELLEGDRPYFLYLHLNDVHKPYQMRAPWYAPGADQRTEDIAQYDSGISYVDSELRRLGEGLGLAGEDAPILCLVSDHGEGFAEHGFYGHGSTLHAELNRVLMVYSGPGIDPGPVDANASLVDVAPTLLELAGLGFESMDGISLRPLLDGGRRAEECERLAERPLFAHRRGMTESALESALHPQELWSVLRGRWRLIDDGVTGELGLYDLEHDPLEQKNLLEVEADQRARLTTLLSKFKELGIRPASGKARVLIDEKLFDDLQKMGYVDGGG
jgi:arylsulfatase A-like enzyme